MRFYALTVSVFVCAGAASIAGDWPHWRGPNHNGISVEGDWHSVWPAAGPKSLWKANVGTGFASFAVSDGQVFTVGNDNKKDTVFCFDAASGKTVWTFAYEQKLAAKYYEGGPSSTPTVDGNHVFTFSKSGFVHCLDAVNGNLIWKKDLVSELDLKEPTWGFAGSPLVQGNRVLFNAGDSGVALDKQSGEVVWSSGKGPGGYSTPLPFLTDKQLCVALMGKSELIAVQVEDGKVLWRHPWKTRHDVNAADPIVINHNRFFISSGYGHGCALVDVEGNKPTTVWENKNMRSQFASPILWEDQLYGIDDKQLVCLDLSSGNLEWKERSVGKGSLMLAGGLMLALSDKGELSVVAPSSTEFEVLSRAQVLGGKCWTVPVLSHGRIYCRNAQGDVVCLDVGEW